MYINKQLIWKEFRMMNSLYNPRLFEIQFFEKLPFSKSSTSKLQVVILFMGSPTQRKQQINKFDVFENINDYIVPK